MPIDTFALDVGRVCAAPAACAAGLFVESAPAVVECVVGVVLKSSLVGEVTPPGLRGEGEDRVRANNLGRRIIVLVMVVVLMMRMIMRMIVVAMLMMILITT